jgi:ribosomal protein L11 methyltransferase
MKWIEAKVAFHHTDTDLAADLIADIFYEFDLQGVVIEDPDIEPNNGWAEDAVARSGGHAVIGYFSKGRRAEKKCKILADKIGQLKNTLGLTYRISYKELDEEDWAEAWKAFFWPQRVGAKIVVKPTWREYSARPDDIVVELDPGMAFGTGTHPTTALCIEMIEAHLTAGDSFLDVGTGSGILMVVASKLGADKIYGVDKDEIAVDIATKNLMLNRLNPDQFLVRTGNLLEETESQYDFIAANILTYVILDLLDSINRVLKSGGIFVCSGILEENQDIVVAKMKDIGFNILEIASKEQWVAITGRFAGYRNKQRFSFF